jgi:hypothetical protein
MVPAFYGTPLFITVFTRPRHWLPILSWLNPVNTPENTFHLLQVGISQRESCGHLEISGDSREMGRLILVLKINLKLQT